MIKILWYYLNGAWARTLNKLQQIKEFLEEFNYTNGIYTKRALLEITVHTRKVTTS